jgi:glycosyltransferase involved in cell wall biosynthesis
VVIPSLWRENLPTTGLNAIAARVPIIVSDGEGLTELIDDYGCGFAYPMGNAEALAAILRDCIARPELLDRVRRDMLYPPSLEEEAVEMEQIYNRLREPQPLRDESAARRPLEHA